MNSGPSTQAMIDVHQMDVTLPVGTTYILVIDTDSYAGNFERQITGYATGIVDVERHHGQTEAEDARESEPELVAGIMAKSRTVASRDHDGEVSNTIRATPGRLNNGSGVHYDAAPGETGWPAYESVAIFLSEPLDEAEMAFVTRRAREFSQRASLWTKPFAILGINQMRTVIAAREERLG